MTVTPPLSSDTVLPLYIAAVAVPHGRGETAQRAASAKTQSQSA